MRKSYRPAVLLLLVLLLAVFISPTAFAVPDPCLIVYPGIPCVYHYDPMEYYTVTYGHPLYDPAYDRGGEVLLTLGSNTIDLSIYQAPNLTGFQVSSGGNEGYFTIGYDFDLIIDGWSNAPRTYLNIQLVFEPDPSDCMPEIFIDGDPVSGPPYVYPIGDLVVSTPTPNGNNYSDTITKFMEWGGCYGIMIWAYADENYNGEHDGGECFTAFSHDTTVPTERSTWGVIKALFE